MQWEGQTPNARPRDLKVKKFAIFQSFLVT